MLLVAIDLMQTELNEVKNKNKQLSYENKQYKDTVSKLEVRPRKQAHSMLSNIFGSLKAHLLATIFRWKNFNTKECQTA